MLTLVQMPWTTSTCPPLSTYPRFYLTSVLPSAIANQESLSGLETEMRKLEGVVKEIVDEMEYLKQREERFQLTNSAYTLFLMHFPPPLRRCLHLSPYYLVSTNTRVQNFAWFMFASLFGLGVWQIFHLRAFFKRKYLID